MYVEVIEYVGKNACVLLVLRVGDWFFCRWGWFIVTLKGGRSEGVLVRVFS